MQQQISDSELELMKIIRGNGGAALYACIMSELEKQAGNGKTHPSYLIIAAN